MPEAKNQVTDLKMLWFFFRPHKIQMAVVLGVMTISGILESLNLAVLYPIIHHGLNMGASNSALRFLDQFVYLFGSQDLFLSSCWLLIAISVLALVSKVIYHYLSNRLVRRIVVENQKNIFKRYASAAYQYYTESQQGKLIYAGTVAPIGISSDMLYALRILNSAITSLCFIALLVALAWQGLIFIVLFGIVYLLGIKKLLKKIINTSASTAVEEDNKVNIILNEFITGIKSIKAFHNQGFWQKKYHDAVEKSAVSKFRVDMGRVLPDSFLKFLFFFSFALIAVSLNAQTQGNILPMIPILGTFAGVLTRLVPYLNLLSGDIVALARFMPDVKIVYRTLTEKIPEFSNGTQVIKDFTDKIEFRHVHFRYEGMEQPILSDVNFTIEKGKVTAIVGSSGSGKSTIVNLLLKFYQAGQGAIEVDGININQLASEPYLGTLGFVSQETFIFNGTIEENICFGNLTATHDDVVKAAQLANAEEFILSAKDGYQSLVGDSGMKLSGGQRQRIAIARAMLRKPKIIILDEATSSLDNISERAVQEAINQISKHTTVLIIAHRLSTVKNAYKIIVLDHGKIIEQGTHEQLLQSGKAYHGLYST